MFLIRPVESSHALLTYDLNTHDRRSLYEQLYLGIRNDIEQDQLRAGDKLPSKRMLAQHLGISVITVENAYRQLIAEGYIEAHERRGYFVSELPSTPRRQSTCRKPETTIDDAVAGTQTDEATPLLADFSGAHRSGSIFPFPIWAKTVRRTLSEASKGRLLQTSHDNCGAEELRAAIADHLAGFRGLTISPERIIIGAGAQDLYGILVQLLGRDRTFAIEDPGYPALRAHYELNDASIAAIPVDDGGMSVAELELTRASIAHCTPAHQFPTGIVMSAPRRRELLDWAQRGSTTERRYIVEDDYDSEFRMHGRPIPPLLASDAHESVIYLNTFTRSLGSVFRIAYMVLPPHLMHEFKKRFSSRACMVGALEQLELAHFIESGNYERHVNRQRTIYRRLQDDLVALLATSDAGPYLRFRGVDAGLHFLMDVDLSPLQKSEAGGLCPHTHERDEQSPYETLEQRALEAGIRLVRVDDYRSTPLTQESSSPERKKSSHERMTYVMNLSGLDAKRADKIGQTLARVIESLRSI